MASDHMTVEQQEHYGAKVWVNVPMDLLRRHQCLCLECKSLLLGECRTGTQLYKLCQERGVALMVTRCPIWVPQDGD